MRPLTPKMKECIKQIIEHPTYSLPEIAELMGVPVRTVYSWNVRDDFQAELDKELHKTFKSGAKIALKTMLNLATEGDYKASEFILKSTGFGPTENVNLSTSNDIVIRIND